MPGTANSGGRNKKSPRLRVLQGTFRPDRAGHETPDPPQGVPTSPKRLTGDASAEWKRMIGRLEKSGTLAVVDDAVLYQYVRLFAETEASVTRQAKNEARAARLEQEIEKHDLEGGEFVAAVRAIADITKAISRAEGHIRQSRLAIRQYLVELGQTPSARTRVRAATGAANDPERKKKERFFGRGSRDTGA